MASIQPPTVNAKLLSGVRGLIDDDETIQAVFAARIGDSSPRQLRWRVLTMCLFPPLCLWALYDLGRNKRRIIAVTDDAIHVFASTGLSPDKPSRWLGRQRRETPLVPHREKRWSSVELGGETVWVHNDSLGQICYANKLRHTVSG